MRQLHKVVMNVGDALTDLRQKFILLSKRSQLPAIAVQFIEKTVFLGVIGAIDGTYILIPAPCDDIRDGCVKLKKKLVDNHIFLKRSNLHLHGTELAFLIAFSSLRQTIALNCIFSLKPQQCSKKI